MNIIGDDWVEDYKATMITATKTDPIKVANQADCFRGEFRAIRNNKKLMEFMLGRLNMWAANTSNKEKFQQEYKKLKKLGTDIIGAPKKRLPKLSIYLIGSLAFSGASQAQFPIPPRPPANHWQMQEQQQLLNMNRQQEQFYQDNRQQREQNWNTLQRLQRGEPN